jgi:hypothetical protein
MDLYQYFILLGNRSSYLFELKNIRKPVFFTYDRFHESPHDRLCGLPVTHLARMR